MILALLPFAYYVLSLCCVIAHFRSVRKVSKTPFMPPASIVKPVRGLDHEAYENFASFCRLDYPVYEVVFAVSDASDPVIPVIEKLRAEFPAVSIRLITDVPHVGASDKVNNLCQLAQNAKYDLLVMSDSDVRVEADYLKQVTAPFADPEVGAVTAFYKSQTSGSLASNLDALGMSSRKRMPTGPPLSLPRAQPERNPCTHCTLRPPGGIDGKTCQHGLSQRNFCGVFPLELRWSIAL